MGGTIYKSDLAGEGGGRCFIVAVLAGWAPKGLKAFFRNILREMIWTKPLAREREKSLDFTAPIHKQLR
ncbi:hypothetical protein K523DRAFT_323312 [Schizophyllum commune Tattone D]|nr:hypothetical protein K523DRAFT_323312 [Schizophyllum commune Tattone D]